MSIAPTIAPAFPRLSAPIVLAHGLFGFTQVGLGRLRIASYFRDIPEIVARSGNRVLTTRVPSIAGIDTCARRLAEQIDRAFPDEPVHLIGHSSGGLDARKLLADPAWRKRVLTLTTIGTPHLGTWMADFAKLRVGRIYNLLDSIGIDPRGCLDVTRQAARRFHRRHPQPRGVRCYSIAGDAGADATSWPMRKPRSALFELEGPNDGLVSVESALAFGQPLDAWSHDHLQQLNWLVPDTSGSSPLALYHTLLTTLAEDDRAALVLRVSPALAARHTGALDAGCEENPASCAEAGEEPGAIDRSGGGAIEEQNLVDSQVGTPEKA